MKIPQKIYIPCIPPKKKQRFPQEFLHELLVPGVCGLTVGWFGVWDIQVFDHPTVVGLPRKKPALIKAYEAHHHPLVINQPLFPRKIFSGNNEPPFGHTFVKSHPSFISITIGPKTVFPAKRTLAFGRSVWGPHAPLIALGIQSPSENGNGT